MSSPWIPKSKPVEAAPPSSPTSSPETAAVETRSYSRYPTSVFGNRLASARNLDHTQAPPPPPPRSVATAASSVVHGLSPKTGPKYGGEKGSYMSPYDYNIPGRTLGSRSGSAFEYDSGPQTVRENARPTSMSFGAMPPVNTAEPPKKERIITMPKNKVEATQAPSNTQERLVLLGPLRMIRQQCANTTGFAVLADFIDTHMADRLHTVVERDHIIPGIVYMVSIPMTDEHWEMYTQVLARGGRALEVHKMLAGGQDEFDRWSRSSDSLMTVQQRAAHAFLLSGASTGRSLEDSMEELVEAYRGIWMNSGSGYVRNMEG